MKQKPREIFSKTDFLKRKLSFFCTLNSRPKRGSFQTSQENNGKFPLILCSYAMQCIVLYLLIFFLVSSNKINTLFNSFSFWHEFPLLSWGLRKMLQRDFFLKKFHTNSTMLTVTSLNVYHWWYAYRH